MFWNWRFSNDKVLFVCQCVCRALIHLLFSLLALCFFENWKYFVIITAHNNWNSSSVHSIPIRIYNSHIFNCCDSFPFFMRKRLWIILAIHLTLQLISIARLYCSFAIRICFSPLMSSHVTSCHVIRSLDIWKCWQNGDTTYDCSFKWMVGVYTLF